MDKNEIIMSIVELSQDVIGGDINPLDAYSDLKEIETILSSVKDSILNIALDEFDKYGEKSVSRNGYEFASTSSGRYDYSNSDDWKNYKKKMKDIEVKMVAAYKNAGTALIDEETGEVYPPASYTESKRSLRLKKLK